MAKSDASKIINLLSKATSFKQIKNQTAGEVVECLIGVDSVRFTRKMLNWQIAIDVTVFTGGNWLAIIQDCLTDDNALKNAWDSAMAECRKVDALEISANFAIAERVLQYA